MKLKLVVMSFLVLSATITCAARSQSHADFAGELDKGVLGLTQGTFWGTIVVTRGEEQMYRQTFGAADYHSQPHGPATRYEIASVSKQFVSVALYRLAEQGLLQSDDPIGVYFESLPKPYRDITIDQLLTHTSGLPSDFVFPYDSTATRDEFVDAMPAHELIADPGVFYSYCNGGYAVLAAVVEVASGRTFEQYLKDEVFDVARLKHTSFIGQPVPEGVHDAHRLARDGSTRIASDWHSGWGYKGMGGIVTTADDLIRWTRALSGESLLSEESKQIMWAPTPASPYVASGWRLNRLRGQRALSHGGGVQGFGTLLTHLRDSGVTIVILSNSGKYLYAIQELILEQLVPIPPVDAVINAQGQTLSEHEGVILNDQMGSIEVSNSPDGSHLMLRVLNRQNDTSVASLHVPRTAAAFILDEIKALGEPAKATLSGSSQELGVYFYAYDKEAPVEINGLKLDVVAGWAGSKNTSPNQANGIQLWFHHEERMFIPVILRLSHHAAYQVGEQIRACITDQE
ncbi:MAG: serine hydrolase domain-containing protein [Phycisphaerales bacterium]